MAKKSAPAKIPKTTPESASKSPSKKTKDAKKSATKNLPANPTRFSDIIGRYHTLMFTIIVGGGLSFAVYLLMMIVNSSDAPEGYQPPSTSSTFDTETIERIELLQPLNTSPSQPTIPGGRTDPFVQ